MPSFNAGSFIEASLLSVLHQGYPDLELILVDGGSTDQTPEVVGRYRDRIAHWISEPDRGQAHALDKGFRRARGEILGWLNSDDLLAPGALAAVAQGFRSSGADLVAGICEIYRDGVIRRRHLTSCPDGPLPLGELLDLENRWFRGEFFFQPEVFFTRDLWERSGAKVDEAWHFSMDYELWLRFAEAGARLHVLGRPIAWFRKHPAQKTATSAGYEEEMPRIRARFLEQSGRRWAGPGREKLPKTRLRVAASPGPASALVSQLALGFERAGHRIVPIPKGWTRRIPLFPQPDLVLVERIEDRPKGVETLVVLTEPVSGSAPSGERLTVVCDDGFPIDGARPLPRAVETLFHPRPRRECRKALLWPLDAFIVLCGPGIPGLAPEVTRRVLPSGNTSPEGRAVRFAASDACVFTEGEGAWIWEAARTGTPSVVLGGSNQTGPGAAPAVHARDRASVEAAIRAWLRDPVRLRTDGIVARVHAENERSPEALYHRLVQALRASGAAGRIGLARGIRFAGEETSEPSPRARSPRAGSP
jgi:hypothetical protein